MSKELASMFVECTGTHMLDSGGAYGRAWQRNQKECGDREPEEWLRSVPDAYIWDVDVNNKWLGVGVHTFHFLDNAVSFDETLTAGFLAWCEQNDEYYNSMNSMSAWLEAGCPIQSDEHECPNCYGEGTVENLDTDADEDEVECSECGGTGEVTGFLPSQRVDEMSGPWGGDRPIMGNTYNEENCMSQDFMFAGWRYEHTEYCAISIHNGADARGGYTDFKIFEVTEESVVYDFRRCGLYAECISSDLMDCMSWYSDDGGNHWYENSSDHPDLEDLPWFNGSDIKDSELPRNEKGILEDCVIVTRAKNYGEYTVLLAFDGELYKLEGSMY